MHNNTNGFAGPQNEGYEGNFYSNTFPKNFQ